MSKINTKVSDELTENTSLSAEVKPDWSKPTLFSLNEVNGGKANCVATELGMASDVLTMSVTGHGTFPTGKSCGVNLNSAPVMFSSGYHFLTDYGPS